MIQKLIWKGLVMPFFKKINWLPIQKTQFDYEKA